MSIFHIESVDDERLADFHNVPEPDLLVRRGLFVAEGRLVVRRLLTSTRLDTRSLLVTESARAALDDLLSVRVHLPVYVAPQSVMNRVTGFNFHRGCLAIGVRPLASDWRQLLTRTGHLLALERLGDADNVGSIFRNAAAFGAGGVLLQSGCADPLYRKAIRTSMAASLSVPFARAEPWLDVLRHLHDAGWATIAMTPSPDAAPLRHVASDVTARPAALVLGHEGEGLTDATLACCSHRARIPMAPGVDSINVATAAAIAMYELGR